MGQTVIKAVRFRHSISKRLLKIVLSTYFSLTFVVTAIHVYIQYVSAKNDIQAELVVVEHTFERSLANAMWNYDSPQIAASAAGITRLSSVIGVEIKDQKGKILQQHGRVTEADAPSTSALFWHEFPVIYQNQEEPIEVGVTRLFSDNKVIFDRIKVGILTLIASAAIKTLALVFLITLVFNRLLTRPLGLLAENAEHIDPNNIREQRIDVGSREEDELKVLEVALNTMMDKVVVSMSELDNLNKELERKVVERTRSLNDTVQQLDNERQALKREVALRLENEQALLEGRIKLQDSLDVLKLAQKQLIESEKMASLGGLVAGVAHEINTPVGLSLTGITHLQYMLENLEKRFKKGELEEQQFDKFLADANEISRSIHISLERAAGLVRSFKQVAVDQSHEVLRRFKVHEYMDEVLLSLRNKIKHTGIKVQINCDEHLELNSYPGAWSQIVTNFITNSLIHAYQKGQTGNITLSFEQRDGVFEFVYADDGKGMSEPVLAKIYDPFYTTNRENGGSGLGLNIVYNLVTQQLNGSINVASVLGKGTVFTIAIPMDQLRHH